MTVSATASPSKVIQEKSSMSAPKHATLYRMVMPGHTCPYGLKSLDLLERKGYKVEDKHLASREQTDAFKKEYSVETTPQAFIDEQRVMREGSMPDASIAC